MALELMIFSYTGLINWHQINLERKLKKALNTFYQIIILYNLQLNILYLLKAAIINFQFLEHVQRSRKHHHKKPVAGI